MKDISTKLTLKLNGHERFIEKEIDIFSRTQVKEHHTGPGGIDMVIVDIDDVKTAGIGILYPNVIAIKHNGFINYMPNFRYNSDSICVYSFAINPEEHQPSGTCNFSRIDSAQLTLTNGCI